jgi:preprotein translocase subunit SecE
MENQQQKWVTMSFVATSALLAILVFSFGQKFAGAYDLEARFRHVEMILQGGSVLLGVLLFSFLYRSDAVNQFMAEVVVELSRVSWPTQKETRAATLLVVVMVLISGLFLGLMDYLWTVLLKWII